MGTRAYPENAMRGSQRSFAWSVLAKVGEALPQLAGRLSGQFPQEQLK